MSPEERTQQIEIDVCGKPLEEIWPMITAAIQDAMTEERQECASMVWRYQAEMSKHSFSKEYSPNYISGATYALSQIYSRIKNRATLHRLRLPMSPSSPVEPELQTPKPSTVSETCTPSGQEASVLDALPPQTFCSLLGYSWSP